MLRSDHDHYAVAAKMTGSLAPLLRLTELTALDLSLNSMQGALNFSSRTHFILDF
jgi:hypothetical protein